MHRHYYIPLLVVEFEISLDMEVVAACHGRVCVSGDSRSRPGHVYTVREIRRDTGRK